MGRGLIALLLVASSAGAAQAQPPSEASPQRAIAMTAEQAEPPERIIDRLPISLEAIKAGLARAPDAPSSLRIGRLPTFRVTIYGQRRSLLPSFQETLKQEWQAPIPGGLYNKELLDMITPPQARPYGAFTNGDLAEVAGTSIVTALAGRALYNGYTSARGALRSWQEERIRQEVEAELEAFKRANGIVDPPPQPPTSKPSGDGTVKQ